MSEGEDIGNIVDNRDNSVFAIQVRQSSLDKHVHKQDNDINDEIF